MADIEVLYVRIPKRVVERLDAERARAGISKAAAAAVLLTEALDARQHQRDMQAAEIARQGGDR